ncbi:hypothetical protein V1511DRAFT_492287 [Dipodascopsis uninucleata]
MPSLFPSPFPSGNASSAENLQVTEENQQENEERYSTEETFDSEDDQYLRYRYSMLDAPTVITANSQLEVSKPSSEVVKDAFFDGIYRLQRYQTHHRQQSNSESGTNFTAATGYGLGNSVPGYQGHQFHIPSSPLSRSTISSNYDASNIRGSVTSRRLSISPVSLSPDNTLAQMRRRRSSLYHSHSEALIGSYEESLLSGRMSTPSSKPAVTFLAKVGVLGMGDVCPPKLRCPRHLLLEFEAVYYDWQSASGSPADVRGSPYVGGLDLEDHYVTEFAKREATPSQDSSKRKRRAGSAFPGYRIPSQGQIQIVISNPHRTAINLFLIPYDLRNMPAGTRTFLRQKTMVVSGSDDSTHSNLKGSLRQAVHIHVVCTEPGKFYLFRNVRLVFENRAIDATATADHGIIPSSNNGTYSNRQSTSTTKERIKVETIVGAYSSYNQQNSPFLSGKIIKDDIQRSPGNAVSNITRSDEQVLATETEKLSIKPHFGNATLENTNSKESLYMSSKSESALSKKLKFGRELFTLDIRAKHEDQNKGGAADNSNDLQSDTQLDNDKLMTWGELYHRRLGS